MQQILGSDIKRIAIQFQLYNGTDGYLPINANMYPASNIETYNSKVKSFLQFREFMPYIMLGTKGHGNIPPTVLQYFNADGSLAAVVFSWVQQLDLRTSFRRNGSNLDVSGALTPIVNAISISAFVMRFIDAALGECSFKLPSSGVKANLLDDYDFTDTGLAESSKIGTLVDGNTNWLVDAVYNAITNNSNVNAVQKWYQLFLLINNVKNTALATQLNGAAHGSLATDNSGVIFHRATWPAPQTTNFTVKQLPTRGGGTFDLDYDIIATGCVVAGHTPSAVTGHWDVVIDVTGITELSNINIVNHGAVPPPPYDPITDTANYDGSDQGAIGGVCSTANAVLSANGTAWAAIVAAGKVDKVVVRVQVDTDNGGSSFVDVTMHSQNQVYSWNNAFAGLCSSATCTPVSVTVLP